MKCPNCKHELNSLTTHSHHDAKVEIDQCPHCGGMWFDGMELYLVKHGLAEVIDIIDRGKLAKLEPTLTVLNCPRDNTVLKLFADRSFPKNIQIEYCPTCSGLWFNRGEFVDFQIARAEIIKEMADRRDDKLAKDFASLLALAEGQEDVERLGNFMAAAYTIPNRHSAKNKKSDKELLAQAINFSFSLFDLFKGVNEKGEDKYKQLRRALVFNNIVNIIYKALPLGMIFYFMVSDAKYVLNTDVFDPNTNVTAWYFRLLSTFAVLPMFYVLKFLNYLQKIYFPELRLNIIGSAFFQTKIFYFVIYGLLSIIILQRWLG